MKRDNELLRSILFEVEEHPHDYVAITSDLSDLEARRKRYHAELLCDAGLMFEVGREVFRLTNAGHDFLEAARDEGIWQKTKDTVATAGGNATMDILKQIALGYLKKQIKDKTGVDIP